MGLLRKKATPPARRRVDETTHQSDAEISDRYAFRRNRTLTGSLVSHVESAGEASSELRSDRLRSHDLHTHRKKLGFYLFVSACTIGVLAWVIYQFIATIQVSSDTSVVVNQSTYNQKVQDYLAANPFQRLRATVDTGSLAAYLQAHDSPEVASVQSNVTSQGFAAAGFTLTFRHPVVVWKTGATRLYVDDEGNAFSRNYYSEPTVEVVDQTGIQAENNQVLASERFLSMIGKLIGRMKAQGYMIERVILPANTTRQFLMSAKGLGCPIKFTIDRSAGEQAEDAARAIAFLSGKGITPEYLDVRVGGKAFYK